MEDRLSRLGDRNRYPAGFPPNDLQRYDMLVNACGKIATGAFGSTVKHLFAIERRITNIEFAGDWNRLH